MPKSPPSLNGTVIAYWVDQTADGGLRCILWPAELSPESLRQAQEGKSPVIANDRELALSTGLIPMALRGVALDFREVVSLARPLSTADNPEALLSEFGEAGAQGNAQALAQAWEEIEAVFVAWPAAQLTLIVQILSAAPAPWSQLAKHLGRFTPFQLESEPLDLPATIVGLIQPHGERQQRRELPTPEDYSPLDIGDVAKWLEPGGRCDQMIDGYEYREGQVQMTRAVTEAFNTQRHLAVEAGTGVGKSVAYLLPSILWALRNHAPVVVSTNTKNLQNQLFHKDIPMLRRILKQPFRAALIKGRMNYVCLRHFKRLLENREEELTEDEMPALAKIVAWILTTSTGDLEELDRVSANGGASLISRLPATAEECGGRSCRFYNKCFLMRARHKSLNADIAVANHSLVFAETAAPQPVALPRHAQIVFDEAHNLEESATRHFTTEISSLRFALAVRRLWRGGGRRATSGLLEDIRKLLHANPFTLPNAVLDAAFERVTQAITGVDAVRRNARSFLQALAALPRPNEAPLRFRESDLTTARWMGVLDECTAVGDELEKLVADLDHVMKLMRPENEEALSDHINYADTLRDTAAALVALAELAADLEFVTSAKDRNFVYWLDVNSRGRETLGSLSAAPVDISELLASEVFSVKESVVLSSATLSVNGSFNFLARRIGLDRIEEGRLMTCQATSPFDYPRQCRVAAPLFLPDPAEAAGSPYTVALADFLIKLLEVTRGRMLVLFTSYEMMRNSAQRMAEPLRAAGITLLMQGEGGSRERLTRTFRSSAATVLLGTDSFWEGVDIIGEALSCVVIARLPFDAINDPLVSARSERIAEEGGSPFKQYSLPNAIIKFRQGFGRLIRHRSDRGCVIITDCRIQKKSYGVHFRRNLPCAVRGVTDRDALLAEIREFLSSEVAAE